MEVTVKVTARPRIEVPSLSDAGLRSVGQLADELIQQRVDSSSPRGIDNAPAPPLREAYKRRKMREGGRGVRDLHRKGDLFRDMGVYRARKGYVYVGFKSSREYLKAFKQQKKYQWFGLSDPEESSVLDRAQGLFADEVKQFGSIGS
jgi:hypothetical protein